MYPWRLTGKNNIVSFAIVRDNQHRHTHALSTYTYISSFISVITCNCRWKYYKFALCKVWTRQTEMHSFFYDFLPLQNIVTKSNKVCEFYRTTAIFAINVLMYVLTHGWIVMSNDYSGYIIEKNINVNDETIYLTFNNCSYRAELGGGESNLLYWFLNDECVRFFFRKTFV